jgi:hypothetical protein
MPPTEPETPAWTPDPADVETLGAAGRKFLQAMLHESEASLVQGLLLLEAAHILDNLTQWRQQASSDATAAKLALAHARTFANLLAALRTW